jgi:hypothetical protein
MLTHNPMWQQDAYRMIQRRAAAGNHLKSEGDVFAFARSKSGSLGLFLCAPSARKLLKPENQEVLHGV